MSVTLPLKKMTFEEKIQTMELLWDDLCKTPEQFKSPDWHIGELKQREQLIKEGKAKYLDWEAVKKEIRKEIE
ncbi:MAG: addiction module protein [Proteobacteria bacterium]|nr:addiction module protein [Pseudomonadota bacterium]